MSGHSKWANIKIRKGKQDAIKGAAYTKLGKLIAIAAKEGGSDPSSNARLKEAIAKAKAANMPNDNIDRAIKKGSGELGTSHYESITYEGYGIGGVAVIVEALTDNKNRTASDVRYIFDKNGGNLGTTGCVSYIFERQGSILIPASAGIGEEELMELALDAGADDFASNEDGYEIITSPAAFQAVFDAVEAANLSMLQAEIVMSPTTEVEITDADQLKKFMKMLEMFEENDDVQEIYHNTILPEPEEE
ncbi:MAG: YebC/PmpR family DNA-binding transcriptional regulator [Eubacteriaceae bacterium]|jgi:YebC/PmpR family DNA-binding regulatory protein|nr:YebC/PmpR family DNA-binding transcriptional regulator [Eubacteriaceae bacterium]